MSATITCHRSSTSWDRCALITVICNTQNNTFSLCAVSPPWAFRIQERVMIDRALAPKIENKKHLTAALLDLSFPIVHHARWGLGGLAPLDVYLMWSPVHSSAGWLMRVWWSRRETNPQAKQVFLFLNLFPRLESRRTVRKKGEKRT